MTILDPDYHDPWVPTVGETDTIEIAGRPGAALSDLVYNRATGTMASTRLVQPETTFVMHAEITPQPRRPVITTTDADHSVGLPAPAMVPDELVARVKEWQGNDEFTGGAEGAWLLFLTDAFKNKGFFSDGDGNVPAGHGFSRLQLLTRTGTQPGGGWGDVTWPTVSARRGSSASKAWAYAASMTPVSPTDRDRCDRAPSSGGRQPGQRVAAVSASAAASRTLRSAR